MSSADIIEGICSEIASERMRQNDKWGEQNHPSFHGEQDRRQAEKAAAYWKQINDAREKLSNLSWDGILMKEVFEALAEAGDERRRAQLIQVAAVAAAEIEAIDRRIDLQDEESEDE